MSGARGSLIGGLFGLAVLGMLCGGCIFSCILPSVWQAKQQAEEQAKQLAEHEAQIAEYAPELTAALASIREQIVSWTEDANQLASTIRSVGQNPADDPDIKTCQTVIGEFREVESKLLKARGDLLIALDKTGRKTGVGDEETRLKRARGIVAKAVEESKRAVRIASAKQRRINGAMGRDDLSGPGGKDASEEPAESASSPTDAMPPQTDVASAPRVPLPQLPMGKDRPLFDPRPPQEAALPAAIPSVPAKPAPESVSPPKTAPEPERVDSLDVKFVLLQPGEFQMGSDKAEIDAILSKARGLSDRAKELLRSEMPKHRVTITKAFYMGTTEITVGQFKTFVAATSYTTTAEMKNSERTWRRPGFAQTDDHPVTAISWSDAVEFCQWASRIEKIRYRLPLEAEWEYACRSGSPEAWSWGSDPKDLASFAWNSVDASKKTRAVATKQANAFGLFDMQGNVSEWCLDWYQSGYYAKAPPADPAGPTSGEARVMRGGSINHADPAFFRSSLRGSLPESAAPVGVGFRVVREID